MEKELIDRLLKADKELPAYLNTPQQMVNITIATLGAIRAHILEAHSDRQGEIVIADTAIELVKGYR